MHATSKTRRTVWDSLANAAARMFLNYADADLDSIVNADRNVLMIVILGTTQ